MASDIARRTAMRSRFAANTAVNLPFERERLTYRFGRRVALCLTGLTDPLRAPGPFGPRTVVLPAAHFLLISVGGPTLLLR